MSSRCVVDVKDAVGWYPVLRWRIKIDTADCCMGIPIGYIDRLNLLAKPRQRSRRTYISTYPCSITSTQVEDVLHRGFIDWTAEQRVLLLRLQDDE